MRLLAAHAAAIAVNALVRDRRDHAGRLADDAREWPDAGLAQVRDQVAHAEAADFLVEAERKMDRERRLAVQKAFRIGDGSGDEALHVGRAATVELAIVDLAAERIEAPVLPLPGNRVRMAGKDHAGRLAFAQ